MKNVLSLAVVCVLMLVPVHAQRPPARPCAGGTSNAVFHAYSECQADGFWHVVTDEYYTCPNQTVMAVRVHDITTDQKCDVNNPGNPPGGITVVQVLQLGESGTVSGAFVFLECISGTWNRVSYPRIVLPDGSVRRDPYSSNFEDTKIPCTERRPPPVTTALLDFDPSGPLQYASLNPPAANTGGLDPGTQSMYATLDDPWNLIVWDDHVAHDADHLRWLPRTARGLLAALGGLWPSPPGWRVSSMPTAVTGVGLGRRAPASLPAQPLSNVQIFLTSLGVSTGEAFDARVVSGRSEPVKLSGEGFAIEPLARQAGERVRRELQRVAGRSPEARRMNAYCLEFLRQPPAAGDVFRIANNQVQQKFAPVGRIMSAARRLRDAGALSPDSEPTGYFHAIRQWAVWTREQGFTLDSYTNAFVDHTKKIFAANRRPWTPQDEQALRAAAPGRWRDIQRVLAEAQQGTAR